MIAPRHPEVEPMVDVPELHGAEPARRAAVRTVRLTPRETDVLRLKFAGAGNKGVARDLGIGEQTVKNHLSSAFRKLGVQGRGIWGAFHALGWIGEVAEVRAQVRAEFQAALDAVRVEP